MNTADVNATTSPALPVPDEVKARMPTVEWRNRNATNLAFSMRPELFSSNLDLTQMSVGKTPKKKGQPILIRSMLFQVLARR